MSVFRPMHDDPFFVAFASNCSSNSAMRDCVCRLIAEAVSRSNSHSGTLDAMRSRFSRTNHRALSCHSARFRLGYEFIGKGRMTHLERLQTLSRGNSTIGFGKDLGEVHHTHRNFTTTNDAFQMHQARHVACGQNFRARVHMIVSRDRPPSCTKRPLPPPRTFRRSRSIRPRRLSCENRIPFEAAQQRLHQTVTRLHHFGRWSESQFSKAVTTLMQSPT